LIPEKYHESIYRAMVHQAHKYNQHCQMIVDKVFEPFSFVRGPNGLWLHADTLIPCRPQLKDEEVVDLPAVSMPVTVVDKDGLPRISWEPDLDKQRRFCRNGNLDGYLTLRGQCSSPVYGVFNDYPGENSLVVRPLDSNGAPTGAKYIPEGEWPISKEEAWQIVKKMFPGIVPHYLELLHCARGCSESGSGKLPLIGVEGPSGSSKTATTRIEARMSGNKWPNMGLQRDDNLSEAFGELSSTSTLGIFDEIFKDRSREHVSAVRKFLLNLNREYSYRKLYVGTVNDPLRCGLVFCDVHFPDEVATDEQLGRRIVHVGLTERVPRDWEDEVRSNADMWMDVGNEHIGVTPEQAQAAANVIHSAIVNRHFTAGCDTSFINIAHKLGFRTMEEEYRDSRMGSEYTAALQQFFAAVCEAYTPDSALEKKHGNGSVAFKPSEDTPIAKSAIALILTLPNPDSLVRVSSLQAAFEPAEGTVRKILKLNAPARLEVKSHKDSAIVVRFVERTESGSTRGKTLRTNRELATDETWKVVEQARSRLAGA